MDTRQIEEKLVSREQDDLALELADEKNKAVKKIERDAVILHEITHDMSYLVASQGITIDNIEHNISSSAAKTDAGIKALENAEKRTNRKRWIIACLVAVVAIGLGIWGGHAIGVALGFTGATAALAGFGIICAAVIGFTLICAGIYAIYRARKSSREDTVSPSKVSSREYVPVIPSSAKNDRSVDFRHHYENLPSLDTQLKTPEKESSDEQQSRRLR